MCGQVKEMIDLDVNSVYVFGSAPHAGTTSQ